VPQTHPDSMGHREYIGGYWGVRGRAGVVHRGLLRAAKVSKERPLGVAAIGVSRRDLVKGVKVPVSSKLVPHS
jgi:hypothetical protein